MEIWVIVGIGILSMFCFVLHFITERNKNGKEGSKEEDMEARDS